MKKKKIWTWIAVLLVVAVTVFVIVEWNDFKREWNQAAAGEEYSYQKSN